MRSRVLTDLDTGEILAEDPKDAGRYRAVYHVAEGTNYTAGTSSNYDFEITKAPLVITAENKTVILGFQAPQYTVIYEGFVNGETERVLTGTLEIRCAYVPGSSATSYGIVPSGLSGKNYTITWQNGILRGVYPEDDSDSSGGKSTSKLQNNKMPGTPLKEAVLNGKVLKDIVQDAQKGAVSDSAGIITGTTITEAMLKDNSVKLDDGLSRWVKGDTGWWFRYADGTYPKPAGISGSSSSKEWVQINGSWWPFNGSGYLSTGWIFDDVYKNWFYVDENAGMKTDWIQIDGKWYYFNPVSDGTKGVMYTNRRTPDGWFVTEDGSWDGKSR